MKPIPTTRPIGRDLVRVLPLLAFATLLLWLAAPIAGFVDRPELAPWLAFAGLSLYGVALSHVLRRLLFPYLDLRKLAEASQEKGLVFLGVCIVMAACLLLMGGLVRAETLPANAVRYMPTLKSEIAQYWPDMPMKSALGAQVEKETCITLKHSRCWSPRAELRTSRERGVGLGQITKTSRFDALAELRAQYPQQLAGWSWDSDRLYDPALQLRALVLMDLRNFRMVTGAATGEDRLAFAFAGYNGGIGGLSSDRIVCRATPGCDPGRWFGHVENTSRKAKVAASGYGESFFAINRRYVREILIVRRPRYAELDA